MSNTLPGKLTREEFDAILAQYDELIVGIDASKPAAKGKKTLKELDDFRYGEALELFGAKEQTRNMDIDDVKRLVEWKLRHGKFRPTLMSLVSGNDADFVKTTIDTAITSYRKNQNAQAALDTLVKLKGIGPATASLLLNVHDPENVIFFSDEAYYWLCGGGEKTSLKYNAKEYVALRDAAKELASRLDVSATDIEKVAYVLMKSPPDAPNKPDKPVKSSKVQTKQTSSSGETPKATPKHKVEENAAAEDHGSLRRSKRARK